MSRKILKLVPYICLIVVLSLTVALAGGCTSTGGDMYKVGISQIVTHPALDDTRQGIIDGLAGEGYIEGENIEYDYQNSEGDMSLVASIAQKFVSDKIDLIVTIATPNSQAAISAAEGTDIPVVFSAVTDPVGAKLISDWNSHPDENVTGVSDMIVVQDKHFG